MFQKVWLLLWWSPFLGYITILIVISGCVETSQHLPCSLQVTTEICKTQEARRISPNTFYLSASVCRMVADRSLDLCDWSLIHLSHVKHGCQVNVMLTWMNQNDQCAVLGWYMKYAQWGHVRRVNLPYKLPSVPLPPSSIFLTALKHAHALPTLSALHPPSPSSCMFFFLCSCLPSINHFTPIYFPLVCCVMSPNLSTCFYLSLRLPLLPVLLLCPFNLIFFFPFGTEYKLLTSISCDSS